MWITYPCFMLHLISKVKVLQETRENNSLSKSSWWNYLFPSEVSDKVVSVDKAVIPLYPHFVQTVTVVVRKVHGVSMWVWDPNVPPRPSPGSAELCVSLTGTVPSYSASKGLLHSPDLDIHWIPFGSKARHEFLLLIFSFIQKRDFS